MAVNTQAVSYGAGAVSDIFQGQATADSLQLKATGDVAEAGNYDLAAALATQNEQFTEQSTAVKQTQEQRQIYMGMGTTQADVAGAGFNMSGSALDLMRSGAQQGALTKQIIGQQGLITEASYNEQAQAYTNMSAAARAAAQTENDMADKAESNANTSAAIKGAAMIAMLLI